MDHTTHENKLPRLSLPLFNPRVHARAGSAPRAAEHTTIYAQHQQEAVTDLGFVYAWLVCVPRVALQDNTVYIFVYTVVSPFLTLQATPAGVLAISQLFGSVFVLESFSKLPFIMHGTPSVKIAELINTCRITVF